MILENLDFRPFRKIWFSFDLCTWEIIVECSLQVLELKGNRMKSYNWSTDAAWDSAPTTWSEDTTVEGNISSFSADFILPGKMDLFSLQYIWLIFKY